MKNLSFALFLVASGVIALAQESPDPFTPDKPKTIDRSSDEKSDEFISTEILDAFGERRLDGGTGKGGPVIRITVFRSFHAPLMFLWYPANLGQESWLHVKRLKFAVNDKGERLYKGLDLNQKLKLRPSQERFLKTLYGQSPLQDLPQDYWTPQALDGSHWVYEAAAADGSILIARRNPVNPFLEGAKIQPERLAHELQLTQFTLMLWGLSGVDEEPY